MRQFRRVTCRLALVLLACPLACLLVWGHAARAQGFDLPGLQADASAYAAELGRPYPAGGTPQQRRQFEQQAHDAHARGDAAAEADALQRRLGAGEPTADLWLALSAALLHKTPPDATHALDAAWQALSLSETGAPEIPALLAIAGALDALHRPAQAIAALEAVTERAPDNAGYRRMLADARHAAGLLVRRVTTEIDTDPPRACIDFSVPPARRDDFRPQDWVHADPPRPDIAAPAACANALPSPVRWPPSLTSSSWTSLSQRSMLRPATCCTMNSSASGMKPAAPSSS